MATQTGSTQTRSYRQSPEHSVVPGDHSTPLFPQPFSPDVVDAALRHLPSHGWTAGWTGRRDRALLVLSHMAGLSYDNIATLRVGDVAVSDGTARISTPGGTTTLRMAEDGLLCGPCALARWLHALDMTTLYPNGRVIAAVIARAVPLTADSPHLCQGQVSVNDSTRRMTLMTASDQWGLCDGGDIAPAPRAARQNKRVGGAGLPSQRQVVQHRSVDTGAAVTLSDNGPDPDDISARFDLLVVGLEGRARQLLDPRSTNLVAH